ncbi:NADH-quinone oxidoreductase subunit G [Gammaproteobacteria bacterium]
MLNIQINGIDIQAAHGTMLIDAAQDAGIVIPRFCYHKKLSTAASCRMCLVEIEKVAKAMPACATPVAEGMKVYTNSPKALSAQRGVMEFLLINHPLDCPICDQGGECPLQDAAVGFGAGISRYSLGKRVLPDSDLGPLVATDMTRCIHCTRCLRFSREIAGVMDLGAICRGEHMAISTYVGYTLTSELAGNLIDLCPVGALTSKPARFSARSWELQAHPAIGPHDSFGSHLRVDVRGGRVMRVVARECEEINETWLSDRDRFSYQGLYSVDRLKAPRIREAGVWREVSWPVALEFVAKGLDRVRTAHGPAALGALVAPAATLEEGYLVQKLMRIMGSPNVDQRLRQVDFSDQDRDPAFPWLGCSISDLEAKDALLVVGSRLRKEHPLVNHRLRKAVYQGAHAMFLDAVARDYNYAPSAVMVAPPSMWERELLAVAKAAQAITGRSVSSDLVVLWKGIEPGVSHQITADYLTQSSSAVVLLGNLAQAHPRFAALRALAGVVAELTGATVGYLPEGAGTVGTWLAGCVPHRGPGGKPAASVGQDWRTMVTGGVKGLVVLGAELDRDCADPAAALKGLKKADFVVSLSPWTSPAQESYAHAILPVAPYAETSGTYVNLEGRWQSFQGVVPPLGETRPAWKVLRVLGNLLNLSGFDYFSSDQVLAEAREVIGVVTPDNVIPWQPLQGGSVAQKGLERIGEVPIYSGDALVRRATALQATVDGCVPVAIRIHSATLAQAGFTGATVITVRQGEGEVDLPVMVDDRIAEGCISIAASVAETAVLGPTFGIVELIPAAMAQRVAV